MFVLAHLSDPHLGPLPQARLRDLAGKRALGFLNWRRNRNAGHLSSVLDGILSDLKAAEPDHIAVTGDLVNISLETEFAPARAWLAQVGAPEQVTVVPGNHDAYVRGALQHPATHWGDYMRGDGVGAAAPVDRMPPFPIVRRRGPVALIGLSTAIPTAPFMATGKLGADQILRLTSTLGPLAREGLFRIVLIHHPPMTIKGGRFKRLVDASRFRNAIAECGAELILHGHEHRHLFNAIKGPNGPVPVVGVPSASATLHSDLDPAAYNLYRISGEAGAWRCELVSRGLKRGQQGVMELTRRVLIG